MKKSFFVLLSLLLSVPNAWAATIVSNYGIDLDLNETKALAPVIITSTSSGDITSEHGIRILLDEQVEILFDKRDLSFFGSALNNGRVNLNPQAVFAEDYKSLFIPVMEDFESGDWLQVDGLALRAYDSDFDNRFLGLDLDGDFEAEVSDVNSYEVRYVQTNDNTAPYPVTDVEYVINANGSVTLTWNKPPDYDYFITHIDRTRIKNGQTGTAAVYSDFIESYTDTDMAGITAVSYTISAQDGSGNMSEPVIVQVDLTASSEPTEAEEPADGSSEEPVVPETEVEEMSRLLNYYNVRYSIKCMPGGVAVAENNSACLWARIDLVYAQEISGETKVDGLVLSERDLELMALRRQWPEQRYQENCIMAETPASYCPALGKALDRISYFLD